MQVHPRFEHVLPCPFPVTVTITTETPYIYIYIVFRPYVHQIKKITEVRNLDLLRIVDSISMQFKSKYMCSIAAKDWLIG